MGDHPPDNKSAKNIYNNREMEVIPLCWPFELGDVPRPDLVGCGRQQFGLRAEASTGLPPSLMNFIMGAGCPACFVTVCQTGENESERNRPGNLDIAP